MGCLTVDFDPSVTTLPFFSINKLEAIRVWPKSDDRIIILPKKCEKFDNIPLLDFETEEIKSFRCSHHSFRIFFDV